MVLGFKPQFVEQILSGRKIHTIREDKHRRWRFGRQIHFATGVRTKNYKQFSDKICTGVQSISIKFNGGGSIVTIDGNEISTMAKSNLYRNDGFYSYDEFKQFFTKGFNGVIIHWTNCRY